MLASQADWPWPVALRQIFQPRGVNLLMAAGVNDFVNILQQRRIHTTIVDMDHWFGGLAAIKLIRAEWPLLPCIVLASAAAEPTLSEALRLDIFSVIGKPVDMNILRDQLNRLFVRIYNSRVFSE